MLQLFCLQHTTYLFITFHMLMNLCMFRIETSFIAKHLSVYKLFHRQTHHLKLSIYSLKEFLEFCMLGVMLFFVTANKYVGKMWMFLFYWYVLLLVSGCGVYWQGSKYLQSVGQKLHNKRWMTPRCDQIQGGWSPWSHPSLVFLSIGDK